MAANGGGDHFLDQLFLFGPAPEAVNHQETIHQIDPVAAIQKRGSAQQAYDFFPTPIVDRDGVVQVVGAGIVLVDAQFEHLDAVEYFGGYFDGVDGCVELLKFLLAELQLGGQIHLIHILGVHNHVDKVLELADVVQFQAQQKTIPDGVQTGIARWQFIRGRDNAPDVHPQILVAVAVNFFVEDGEQGVLNGRASFPNFV